MENDLISQSAALEPISEGDVQFQGRAIHTATLADQQGYVSLNSLCDAFGLDAKAQRKRLRRSSYYEDFVATILMKTAGGRQAVLCINAIVVPLFVASVQLERVSDEERRDLLRAFMDESAGILAEHFGISEQQELRFLRSMVARMAAEQEAYDQDLKKVQAELSEIRQSHEEKVQQIRDAFGALRAQVNEMRRFVGPKQRLSDEQLGTLRLTVQTLGDLMVQHGAKKPYPGIYVNITRITGIAKSENIRQEDFARVMEYLQHQIDVWRSLPPGAVMPDPAGPFDDEDI